MSQYDFGTINPATTSGTALATLLGAFRTALESQHSGSSRPAYAIAGTLWLDTTGTPYYLKMYDGADDIIIGAINATGNVFGGKFNKGANVASATALPLIADGNSFDITGTTTITSINTVAIGTIAFLHFTGTPLLTHHATDLILPGAANIQTAAGDEAIFVEYAAGDWRCINYQQAARSAIQHAGAAVSTTSGTSIDFTGIPPWAKRITIMLSGVSTSGTSLLRLRLGDSGGIETAGYNGGVGIVNATPSSTAVTDGFPLPTADAAASRYGKLTLDLLGAGTFSWIANGIFYDNSNNLFGIVTGSKSTSAALDRISLTTVGGTDTFDAGAMNITWE